MPVKFPLAGRPAPSRPAHAQVKRGIQWLAAPRQEHLRLAGVLTLRQLAENAPAIFNVHVRSFIEVIWNPLRDSRQHVREAAVAALRACLVLVEKRETRYRVQVGWARGGCWAWDKAGSAREGWVFAEGEGFCRHAVC